ncbi:hypothetical protein [Providencia stuartii]|uniref:hypothetical protein n=1 Tax=Providencia stuartii TaxID=588 RepID=UPI001874FEE9|nr:hypothetical protein [Providencia thailandensis]GHB81794.1 hypothetical protein GCM10007290_01810 [Providencia thailandensis]
MATIHYTSNTNVLKPDIRTGLFMYRFISKNNVNQREYINAPNDVEAKKIMGDNYMFAARFRQEVRC